MLTRFEETVLVGDPKMREETPPEMRELQTVYRREQVRQLRIQLEEMGLDPNDIEFYPATWEKNLCPSTGFESEGGILYNRRTGVSVSVVLDWVCEWACGPHEWRLDYEPTLQSCQPRYFFTHMGEDQIAELRTPGKAPLRQLRPRKAASGWSNGDDWGRTGTDGW
jgi:hypothetical protein